MDLSWELILTLSWTELWPRPTCSVKGSTKALANNTEPECDDTKYSCSASCGNGSFEIKISKAPANEMRRRRRNAWETMGRGGFGLCRRFLFCNRRTATSQTWPGLLLTVSVLMSPIHIVSRILKVESFTLGVALVVDDSRVLFR